MRNTSYTFYFHVINSTRVQQYMRVTIILTVYCIAFEVMLLFLVEFVVEAAASRGMLLGPSCSYSEIRLSGRSLPKCFSCEVEIFIIIVWFVWIFKIWLVIQLCFYVEYGCSTVLAVEAVCAKLESLGHLWVLLIEPCCPAQVVLYYWFFSHNWVLLQQIKWW